MNTTTPGIVSQPVAIDAAVIDFHDRETGEYQRTCSEVMTPKGAEQFCQCYNLANSHRAVARLVQVPPHGTRSVTVYLLHCYDESGAYHSTDLIRGIESAEKCKAIWEHRGHAVIEETAVEFLPPASPVLESAGDL